jgi:hypothetical protein
MLKILLPLILLTLVSLASAQHKVDEPISDELYEIVKAKSDTIRTELVGLDDHDWAGDYLLGDHHPTVFSITPKNGFVVTSSLHTFSPSWVNYGRVEFANGRIRIFPELADDAKSAHVMPKEFVLVRWGGYRHLIPADELVNFAYDVHSRSGYATVNYYTRSSKEDPKGMPELPPEFSKILRMQPIVATVLAVEKQSEKTYDDLITINTGSKKGVIKGMYFFLTGYESFWIRLRVIEVSENTAKCEIYGWGSDGTGPDDIAVKKGYRFSSRAGKNYSGM